MFLNQIDTFNKNQFMWVTAHGFDAAYEPRERYDPKLKHSTKGAAVKVEEMIGDDDDAEDRADGAGDEG